MTRDVSQRGADSPNPPQRSSVATTPGPTKGPMILQPDGRLVNLRPGERVSVRASAKPKVDICFVFDTTGSMSDKVDGLVACTSDMVIHLARMELDWRVTTVPFGDLTIPGDRVVAQLPFVSKEQEAIAQLHHMPRFSGGSNVGESAVEAMQAGLGKPWRQGAVKLLVLLTDEPALGSDRASSILMALRRAESICFVASPDIEYFRAWAEQNGGAWYPISASMDTGKLLALLRGLVRRMVVVAQEVHTLAGGSVHEYLRLSAPKG